MHPCIQDPLNTSQCRFLHLYGHRDKQRGENLLASQPTNVNNNNNNYYYYHYYLSKFNYNIKPRNSNVQNCPQPGENLLSHNCNVFFLVKLIALNFL